MPSSQAAKAEAFRALHSAPGTFLMPNAWDAGSAKLLAAAGFAPWAAPVPATPSRRACRTTRARSVAT